MNKTNQIILNHTFGKSFRFGKQDTSKILLPLIYFYGLLKKPIINQKTISGKHLIFDINVNAKETRIAYLNYYNGTKGYEFIVLDDFIGFTSNKQKIWFTLFNLPLVGLSFLTSLFYKDKSSFALLIQHKLQWKNLMEALKNNVNTEIYYYCIYDNSSNYLADKLLKLEHKIIKITSLAPISMWNSNILTDTLVVNTAYQLDEAEHFANTIQANNIIQWGPERSHEYIDLYEDKDLSIGKNKIGFYSTGGWIRAKQDHMDQGLNIIDNENTVLRLLQKVVDQNKTFKLTIFLHPKEKKLGLDQVREHYNLILNSHNFKINDTKLASSHCFQDVDLAVAFHSSIIYERLFMGFKTILYPVGMDKFNFPIKNSSIKNICAETENELEQMIILAMNQCDNLFFEKNNLKQYIYPKPKIHTN
ncbi:hypothetical protein [Crocinitomix catalasitica]|uniref:hypothetical protein n=1 Tax=Crocinitomix catalasitica TaxID=184607 RepID=UPI0012F93B81|nr:hypothetical protein [Crocinitomix catalasitica]